MVTKILGAELDLSRSALSDDEHALLYIYSTPLNHVFSKNLLEGIYQIFGGLCIL